MLVRAVSTNTGFDFCSLLHRPLKNRLKKSLSSLTHPFLLPLLLCIWFVCASLISNATSLASNKKTNMMWWHCFYFCLVTPFHSRFVFIRHFFLFFSLLTLSAVAFHFLRHYSHHHDTYVYCPVLFFIPLFFSSLSLYSSCSLWFVFLGDFFSKLHITIHHGLQKNTRHNNK